MTPLARVVGIGLAALVVFVAGVWVGRATSPSSPVVQATEDRPASAVGAREQPVPMGGAAEVGTWRASVVDVVDDAASIVRSANQFNTDAPEGHAFVLVEVELVRQAVGPGAIAGSLGVSLVTPVGSYPLQPAGCGVLPRPLDVEQVLGEGSGVRGEWCWSVELEDIPKLVLELIPSDGPATYFSLFS